MGRGGYFPDQDVRRSAPPDDRPDAARAVAAVRVAEGKGVDLAQLSLKDLQNLEARITADVYKVLTPEASAASRQSYGGTAPDQVRLQIKRWKELRS